MSGRAKKAAARRTSQRVAAGMTVAQEIAWYDEVAIASLTAGHARDAIEARKHATRLRADLRREASLADAMASGDEVVRLSGLAAVAMGEGSWVASKDMLRQAGELQAQRDAEEEQRRLAELEGLTEDELAEEVIGSVAGWPRPALARVVLAILRELQLDLGEAGAALVQEAGGVAADEDDDDVDP